MKSGRLKLFVLSIDIIWVLSISISFITNSKFKVDRQLLGWYVKNADLFIRFKEFSV